MKLLLSNDDGIFAPGIRTPADAGHQVTVVRPDRNCCIQGRILVSIKPDYSA